MAERNSSVCLHSNFRIKTVTIRPRKSLGQHFLTDFQVISKIMEAISPTIGESWVEIGAGLGALTQPLLSRLGKLTVIELDRGLIPLLQDRCQGLGHLEIHQANALDFDFTTLAGCPNVLHLVGNLPYNISTPLIFHLIDQLSVIKDMCFMLQKEVVDRMAAKPGSKIYGRLSVMTQYYLRVEPLFVVKPHAFNPPPKVLSEVVRLTPITPLILAKNTKLFSEVVKAAFTHRRKTLSNSLKGLATLEDLEAVKVRPIARAEELTVEEFVLLGNRIWERAGFI